MNDTDLLQQFESLTLPFDQWTHRAHVRMAFIYLSQFSFDLALGKICAGIRAFNLHHNVSRGPDQRLQPDHDRCFCAVDLRRDAGLRQSNAYG